MTEGGVNIDAFCKIVISFAVFSFAGWVSETVICSYNEKHFVKRGFLSGPFIPIYGFGGLIIVDLPAPLHNHPILLYVSGVILVTILEYVTAVVLEDVFKIKLWDYSGKKGNYKGRIWICSSLFFGVLGMFGVYVLNPPLTRFLDRIPQKVLHWATAVFLVYFIADTVNSILTLSSIQSILKEFSKQLQTKVDNAKENYKTQLAERLNWFQKRFLTAYPHLKVKNNNDALAELKSKLKELRTKNKEAKAAKKQAT